MSGRMYMKADAYDLEKVFGYNRQLFAPLFQRPYVWEEEKQWKPLWEDISSIANQFLNNEENIRPHFLGAVVLEQFKVPVGKPDARSIIDGQQRLSTIQIFLAALRDICNGNDHLQRDKQLIELLIFNHESMVENDGEDGVRS